MNRPVQLAAASADWCLYLAVGTKNSAGIDSRLGSSMLEPHLTVASVRCAVPISAGANEKNVAPSGLDIIRRTRKRGLKHAGYALPPLRGWGEGVESPASRVESREPEVVARGEPSIRRGVGGRDNLLHNYHRNGARRNVSQSPAVSEGTCRNGNAEKHCWANRLWHPRADRDELPLDGRAQLRIGMKVGKRLSGRKLLNQIARLLHVVQQLEQFRRHIAPCDQN